METLQMQLLVMWVSFNGIVLLLLNWANRQIRRARRFQLALAAIELLAASGEESEAAKLLEKLMKAHQA